MPTFGILGKSPPSSPRGATTACQSVKPHKVLPSKERCGPLGQRFKGDFGSGQSFYLKVEIILKSTMKLVPEMERLSEEEAWLVDLIIDLDEVIFTNMNQ